MQNYIFNLKKKRPKYNEIVQSLDKNGFAKIENLFSYDCIEKLALEVDKGLENPAICGSFGYSKKDHFRKYIYPPMMLGTPLKEVILNKFLIEIVENYFNCEPIIAELHIKHDQPKSYVYFPIHLDLFPGWKKSNTFPLIKIEDMKKRLGLGCLVYLTDCDIESGNFMYAKGTHKNIFLKGGAIKNYSKEEINTIKSKLINLDGKKGDFILFDDRGWHGPNQPSKKNRTVIELDFTNPSCFGRWQASDLQIPISMLDNLKEKDLRILGKNSKAVFNKYNYKISTFNKNPLFNIQKWLINKSFILDHYKKSTERILKNFK